MEALVIKIENLTKSFQITPDKKKKNKSELDPRQDGKTFNALTNVSFSFESGEVLGLLGPNGAGKTTTLRILSTALQPDSGSVIINDVDVIKNPLLAKKRIGFLSGKTGLYNRLTARENIEYFAKLHGMADKDFEQYSLDVYKSLEIEAYLDRRVEHLSTGMQQKVSIARAVIHKPDLLVLDEPTTGLDIMATESIMDFIQVTKAQGTPVIFSTHHLDEVALLADRIAVINQGESCYSGTLEDFKSSTGENDLRRAFRYVLDHKIEPIVEKQDEQQEQQEGAA